MARLTDLELDDLRQEQSRADEEQQLRYEAGVREINEKIYEQWEAVRLSRDALVPPRDLEWWRIVRAYRSDIARTIDDDGNERVGEPRRTWIKDYEGARHVHPCDHYKDGKPTHQPGTAESVACRLGISRKSLYRRLGGFGIKSWPPPPDTPHPPA